MTALVNISQPQSGKQLLTSIFQPVIDFLFPPFCVVCDSRLTEYESRVCSQCWNSFTRIEIHDEAYNDLKSKFNRDGIVTDCYAPFLFEKDGTLQHVLHYLKYKRYTTFGVRLGVEVGKSMVKMNLFKEADLIIPVPLHSLKRRERGYNQSEYICKGISSVLNIPTFNSVLKRTKFTESQTHLDLEQRNSNVANAFVVEAKYHTLLTGKNVIIVDDVVTTGSTIVSCARELRKYGVADIFSVSVAHGL